MRAVLLLLLVVAHGAATDSVTALLAEICPAEAAAWPPFQLARHAVALKPDGAAAMSAAALARQQALLARWLALRAQPEVAGAGGYPVLAYAFGDLQADAAASALAAAAPAHRLALARLLLADAAPDEALALLLPLLGAWPDDASAVAAARLVADLVRDREALAAPAAGRPGSPLMPLRLDARAALAALRTQPRWQAWFTADDARVALERGTQAPRLPIVEELHEEWERGVVQTFSERTVDWEAAAATGTTVGLRLDASGDDFHLHRRDAGWPRRGSAVIDCRSAYHGPIAFALHRCADRAAWDALDPGLLLTPPLRRWSQTFLPLSDCNRQGAVTGSTRIGDLAPGWYVVSARARGAPVVAAIRLAVSAVQLTVLADRRQAVVVAVDRATGLPIADAAVAVALIAADGAAREAGRARTAADGSALIALPTDAAGAFTVRVTLADDGTASAEAGVPAAPEPDGPRAALWSAEPLLPPGATAQLAGVLRSGHALALPATGAAVPELTLCRAGAVVARHIPRLDRHGRFAWRWTVPADALPGDYRAAWAGHETHAFTVSSREIPGFTVQALCARSSSTWLPGETAQIDVHVRSWDRRPLADVRLAISGLPAGLSADPATATTDRDGRARVGVRIAADAPAQAATCRVDAIASDGAVAHQRVSFAVTDQPFAVGPETWRWPAEALNPTVGSAVGFPLSVHTWDGQPCAGAQATVLGEEGRWTTADDGTTTIPLPTAAVGQRTLTVVVEHAGRQSRIPRSFTVRPARRQRFAHGDEPLALLDEFRPFRREVRLQSHASGGPTWHLDGRVALADGAPFPFSLAIGARADRPQAITTLLWSRRSGDGSLVTHRVLRLPAGEQQIALPLAASLAPHAEIGVLALDGDQQAGAVDRLIAVAPAGALRIEPDAAPVAAARPGSTWTLNARISDGTGAARPGCAVVCRIVDRALIAQVRSRHERETWWRGLLDQAACAQPRMDDTAYPGNATLRWWTMGLPLWERSRPALGSGARRALGMYGARHGAGHAGDHLVHLREDWRRLALWLPDLSSDAKGRVAIRCALPDSLTTWQVDLWAVSDDGAIGAWRGEVATRLGVAGSLPMPAFVRDGDHLALRAGVASWDPGIAEARLELRLDHLASAAAAPVPLRHGDQVIAPGQDSGTALVAVPAAGTLVGGLDISCAGSVLDRVRKRVPILPAGWPRSSERSLDAQRATPLDLDRLVADPRRHPGSVVAELVLDRGPGAALADALAALHAHPHGCVEQTLSRFLPAAISAHAAGDATSLLDRTALTASAAAGVARLHALQRRDGGWGWFGGGGADPLLTALVVGGLDDAQRCGVAVPAPLLARGTAALAAACAAPPPAPSPIVGRVDTRLLLLTTLAEADPAAAAGRLGSGRSALAATARAGALRDRCLAARLLRALGDQDGARAALPALLADARPRAGDRESILAAGEILDLDRRLGSPDTRRRAALVAALLAARQPPAAGAADGWGAGAQPWGDTYATAVAARGLAGELVDLDDRGRRVEVRVGDRIAATLDADRPRLRLDPAALGGALAVVVPYGQARCRLRLRWSSDDSPASGGAGPAIDLIDAQPALGRDGGSLLVDRAVPTTLTWRVTLAAPLEFACLAIPLPSGVDVLDAACPGTVASGMVGDAWCAYATRWPAGELRVTLRLSAAFSGLLQAPPPRLWPMYGDDPGTRCRVPQRWRVRDDAGR